MQYTGSIRQRPQNNNYQYDKDYQEDMNKFLAKSGKTQMAGWLLKTIHNMMEIIFMPITHQLEYMNLK